MKRQSPSSYGPGNWQNGGDGRPARRPGVSDGFYTHKQIHDIIIEIWHETKEFSITGAEPRKEATIVIQENGETRLLVGVKDAARMCGVSKTHWKSLDAMGLIPLPMKLGERLLWCVAELTAWTRHGCLPRAKWIPLWESMLKNSA